MTATLQTIRFSINGRGKKVKTRKETYEDRPHTVAPAAILEQGVIPGSNGPGFYPDDEIGHPAAVANWNHKPIVLFHPELEGKPISACDPVVVERQKIGIMFNSVKDSKLRTECYFDDARVDKLSPELREALDKELPMELSTGVFSDNEKTSGTYNGIAYEWIARNLRADHLAILPGKIGAYSIEMGGGLFSVNQAAFQEAKKYLFTAGLDAQRKFMEALSMNELSFVAITTTLNTALREKFGKPGVEWYGYVEDVYSDFFVYYTSGKLYRLKYSVSGDTVKLNGEPEEVVRVTEYRTTSGTFVGNMDPVSQKENVMAIPKEKVDSLISLNAGWEQKDFDHLSSVGEPLFAKLEEQAKRLKEHKEKTSQTQNNNPTPTPPTPGSTPTPPNPGTTGLESWLSTLPEAARRPVANLINMGQQQVQGIIANIMSAPGNAFTAVQLAEMDLPILQNLNTLADAAKKAAAPPPPNANQMIQGLVLPQSYAGQTAGLTGNTNHKEEPLKPRVMDFSDRAGKN